MRCGDAEHDDDCIVPLTDDDANADLSSTSSCLYLAGQPDGEGGAGTRRLLGAVKHNHGNNQATMLEMTMINGLPFDASSGANGRPILLYDSISARVRWANGLHAKHDCHVRWCVVPKEACGAEHG